MDLRTPIRIALLPMALAASGCANAPGWLACVWQATPELAETCDMVFEGSDNLVSFGHDQDVSGQGTGGGGPSTPN